MRVLPLLLVLAACAPSRALAPEADEPTLATDAAPTAVRARALAEAMQRADTEAAGDAIALLLLDAGLDLPDDLRWSLQPFDAPVNYYSSGFRSITISEMPTAAQTPRYWAAWSDLLTGGAWSPEVFFRDSTEAQRLAAYNQAVIAAHELGHALAYRYAVNPRTDDGNVNCQELLADRVAVAVADRLGRADARFRDLHGRYLALLAGFNAAIPDSSRHTMPPRADLLDDCRSVHVDDVTADPRSLVPYASAFFARHGRLHEDGGPEPLATLADSVFLPRLRAYDAAAPEARGPVSVSTEGPYRIDRDLRRPDLAAYVAGDLQSLTEWGLTRSTHETAAVAVSPEGTAWALAFHATIDADSLSASHAIRLYHLTGDGTYTETDFGPDADGEVWALEALAALSDSTFLGLAQLTAVATPTASLFRLFRYRPGSLSWGPGLPLAPEAEGYRLHRLPSGPLALAGGGALRGVDADALTVGTPTGVPGDAALVGIDDEPGGLLAIDRDALGWMTYSGGRMEVEPGGSVLYRLVPEGDGLRRERLAGSGYPATRDATDPDRVAFQAVLVAQPLADGTLVVIEDAPFGGYIDAVYVRRLRVPE